MDILSFEILKSAVAGIMRDRNQRVIGNSRTYSNHHATQRHNYTSSSQHFNRVVQQITNFIGSHPIYFT